MGDECRCRLQHGAWLGSPLLPSVMFRSFLNGTGVRFHDAVSDVTQLKASRGSMNAFLFFKLMNESAGLS